VKHCVDDLQVDESAPLVTVQIRLHNGKRVVAKFNEHHTVGDLLSFVAR
jgi:UBX domain-containing protein 1